MSHPDGTEADAGNGTGRDTSPPGAELFAPLLCLIGLCICVYLSIMHYGLLLGNTSLGGVCGGGTWGDCNSVVASRFGKLFGLPVSIWGMGYYIVAGTLSLGVVMLRRQDAPAFAEALLRLTIAAVAFDAFLAWTMWWYLERFCPLCAATYAVNVIILVIALRCSRRVGLQRSHQPQRMDDVEGTGRPPWRPSLRALLPSVSVLLRPADPAYYREVLKTFFVALGAGGCVLIVVISLLVSRSVLQKEQEKLASLLEYIGRIDPFYIATEGRPSRGPEDAALTLVVFSDFLCEQCKQAGEYLDIVAANHRDSMRIVYMHYPVDDACNEHAKANRHPGACTLAQAAECAHRQGRFWEFHNEVFSDAGKAKPEKVTDYATRSGLDIDAFNACLAEPQTTPAVQADIAIARAVGVTATPTTYINGRPVVGALKPWMLEAAIDAIAPLPLPILPASADE